MLMLSSVTSTGVKMVQIVPHVLQYVLLVCHQQEKLRYRQRNSGDDYDLVLEAHRNWKPAFSNFN